MIERHLAKLRARHPISAAEEEAIRDLVTETRTIPARRTAIREGDKLSFSTLLLDGVMSRYKDVKTGQRQITGLHVPGDFADMHSFTLKHLDHNVATLTTCTFGLAPHDRIRALVERYPRLGRIYWFGTNLDAAIHREWEVSLGVRSAPARVAALFCELHIRLGIVGMAQDQSFALPITQAELAECLGITSVHTNRALKLLREMGLVEFKGGRVAIADVAQLRRYADFDDAYLYLDADPL